MTSRLDGNKCRADMRRVLLGVVSPVSRRRRDYRVATDDTGEDGPIVGDGATIFLPDVV